MQYTPVILKLVLVFISDVVREGNTSYRKCFEFSLVPHITQYCCIKRKLLPSATPLGRTKYVK